MGHYTKSNMEMLESIIRNHGFSIRFEKGNFQSGFCLLNDRKVVIINRFFDKESRFQVLTEIMQEIPIDDELLDDKERKLMDRAVPGWQRLDLFHPSPELIH